MALGPEMLSSRLITVCVCVCACVCVRAHARACVSVCGGVRQAEDRMFTGTPNKESCPTTCHIYIQHTLKVVYMQSKPGNREKQEKGLS